MQVCRKFLYRKIVHINNYQILKNLWLWLIYWDILSYWDIYGIDKRNINSLLWYLYYYSAFLVYIHYISPWMLSNFIKLSQNVLPKSRHPTPTIKQFTNNAYILSWTDFLYWPQGVRICSVGIFVTTDSKVERWNWDQTWLLLAVVFSYPG